MPRAGSAGARPYPALVWGSRDRLFHALPGKLAGDIRAEADAGRLILWLPVLMAAGMLAYFGAEQEPSLVATGTLTLFLATLSFLARRRLVSFALLVALTALATGFAVATFQTARIAHPVILPPAGAVKLTGYVEQVERRATADRILLRVITAEGRGLSTKPELVRLSLARGSAPPAGSAVSQLARLLPPLGPAEPGAHDFGRAPWFQGIAAVGYGLGKPKAVVIDTPPSLRVRIGALLEAVRSGLSARIRASLGGSAGDIAVALVTGDRAHISPAVEESMRLSGLTHVLSISGLHMALVAGTLFALVRGILALSPVLALGYPLKSMAAAVAVAGSAFYLALSGNDVPAQRSFLMAAIVLLGVLVGRPALNLRTVAVAAVLVLVIAPVSVLDPGTQMSFAATLALVAAYERCRPLWSLRPPDSLAWRILFKVALFLAGLALTSLVAGLATAPFGALHFQRLAPYGLLANLAAMPAVSLLVMPFGLIGVLLMPFGFDHLAWPVMGAGIDIMVGVSDRVAALPGSAYRTDVVTATSAGAAALALCCLCLLRGWLVAVAVVPATLAVLMAGAPPRPDVLVSQDGRTVAVRDGQGRLSIAGATANKMVASQWLTRDGDMRVSTDLALTSAFICDTLGCVATLPGGGRIALSRRPEGLEADCLEADMVVTAHAAPLKCPARVFSPATLARTGPVALFRTADGWREVPARNPRVQRPWMAEWPISDGTPAGSEDAAATDAT